MSENKVEISFKTQYPDLTKPMDIYLMKTEDKDVAVTHNYAKASVLANAAAMSVNGRRSSMEDYAAIDQNGDLQFYGVFDGHGGWKIAAILANELPKRILEITDIDYADPVAVTDAVRNVCWILGQEIYELKDCYSCGSTAVFAIRYKKYLYVVNIGDSRAVLFNSKGEILLKTRDHKPQDEEEKNRIEKRGSYVYGGRVDACLAVSRSFGDNIYNYNSKSKLNQSNDKPTDYAGFETVVTHEPDIYPFVLPESEKIYLILGTDGFWDFCNFDSEKYNYKFDFTEVVQTVQSELPLEASRKLVEMAYETTVYDNITVVVAELD